MTRAPPTRSDTGPAMMRAIEPTSGPRKAKVERVGRAGERPVDLLDEQRKRRRQPGERAEGHDVEQRHVEAVLLLEDVELLAEIGAHRHASEHQPRDDAEDDDEGDVDRRRVLEPDRRGFAARPGERLRAAEKRAGKREADDPRRHELDDADAEIADAGLDGERRALEALRKEEARRGHEGGEVAAAEPGEEGENDQHPDTGSSDPGRRRTSRPPGSGAEASISPPPSGCRRAAPGRCGRCGSVPPARPGIAASQKSCEEVSLKPIAGSRTTSAETTNQTMNASDEVGRGDGERAPGEALSGRLPEAGILGPPVRQP